MACITLEPQTKSVKKQEVDKATGKIVSKHLYWEGHIGIKIFDDTDADGISMEMYKRIVKRQGEKTILHDTFEAEDKNGNKTIIPARKAVYHGNGEFEFWKEQLGSKKYYVGDEIAKAFAVVAEETADNLPELEKLKEMYREKNRNGLN